jgi:hypothetical protein
MSSLGTNGSLGNESISAFDRSKGTLDSAGRMHFPSVSMRNIEYIPEVNQTAVRQSLVQGKSMSNVHNAKQMDLHDRSVNSLDLSALRSFAMERNSNNWEDKNLVRHQSSSCHQNSSEIQTQNQGHTPIGYIGNANQHTSYHQINQHEFPLDHPHTWHESRQSNQFTSSQAKLALPKSKSRSQIPSNRSRSHSPHN